MILVIDVYYHDGWAKCAAGLFEHWQSEKFYKNYEVVIEGVAEYVSGQFYKRELPCIMKILEIVEEDYEYILIDGYVFLGEESGLGKHLWDALTVKKPIIGVAKNYFKGTSEECAVLRGKSQKPLYVSAIDLSLEQAKQNIVAMYGMHRIPELIKQIDAHTRI